MNTNLSPPISRTYSKTAVGFGIAAWIFISAVFWWANDLWDLATEKWSFLDSSGAIQPNKLLQLSAAGALLALGFGASIACGLAYGWTVSFLGLAIVGWAIILGFAYMVTTVIRLSS